MTEELKKMYETQLNDRLVNAGYSPYSYHDPIMCLPHGFSGDESKTKVLLVFDRVKWWGSVVPTWLKEKEDNFDIEEVMKYYPPLLRKCDTFSAFYGSYQDHLVRELAKEDSGYNVGILWTMIDKLHKDSWFGNREEMYFAEDINIDILQEEIRILNPDVIIFATKTSNNNGISDIKKIFWREKDVCLFVPIKEYNNMCIVSWEDLDKTILYVPDSFPPEYHNMCNCIKEIVKNRHRHGNIQQHN